MIIALAFLILAVQPLSFEAATIRAAAVGPDAFRFDLVATTSTPASEDKMHLMLQALLIERFALKVREETRELPGYAMTASGKTKLRPSAANRDSSQEGIWGKCPSTM